MKMKKISTLVLSFLLLLGLSLTITHVQAAAVTGSTIVAYFDTGAAVPINLNGNYGSKLSVSPSENSGYEFAFWVVNGVVRKDLAPTNQFMLTNNLELKAVYAPEGQFAVAFMDSNGKLLKVDYFDPNLEGGDAVVPPVSLPSKPGFEISVNPWGFGASFTAITEHKVFVLQYTQTNVTTYDLTVTNGSSNKGAGVQQYTYNEIATVTPSVAPEGQVFSHWLKNGEIVSQSSSYQFSVFEDTSVEAAFAVSAPTPAALVSISDSFILREGKISFIGQYYLPAEYELVEVGLLEYDFSGDYTLSTNGVTKFQSERQLASTNEFLMSLSHSDVFYLRAYVVALNDLDEIVYAYSRIHSTGDLLISEYGEGSSNNKWIELYNPRSTSINLANYSVALFANGASSATSTSVLTGSLASGDAYVICHSSASASIKANCDLESGVANFNGDDALALIKSTVRIDQFGVIGTDPGTEWTLTGGSTLDRTLIRKIAVLTPNTVWNSDEWNVNSIDYISDIGFHQTVSPSSITISGDTSVMIGNTLQLLIVYSPINSIRGVTWGSSNNEVATISSNGLVTPVSEGQVTITATSTSLGSISDTHTVTVTAPVSYAVTFDSNEGSAVSPQSILEGNSATSPTAPTRSGFSFGGWFTDDETFLTQYNFSSAVTTSFTLYAKWNAIYTVTFDSNGGSAVSSQNVTSGGQATSPANPSLEGYTFEGWFTDDDTFLVAYVFSTPVTSNITLYAKWDVASEEPTEDIVYTTGWEDGTNENAYSSVKSITSYSVAWSLGYGNVVSSSAPVHSGTLHSLFRVAKNTSNTASLTLTGTMTDLTKITFYARATTATNATMNVFYQIGSGGWVLVSTFTPTTTYALYESVFGTTQMGEIRVKIEMSYSSQSSSTRDFLIDNVTLYGLR
jgi:uncharacterized repeat protein (TIGR02543 family)